MRNIPDCTSSRSWSVSSGSVTESAVGQRPRRTCGRLDRRARSDVCIDRPWIVARQRVCDRGVRAELLNLKWPNARAGRVRACAFTQRSTLVMVLLSSRRELARWWRCCVPERGSSATTLADARGAGRLRDRDRCVRSTRSTYVHPRVWLVHHQSLVSCGAPFAPARSWAAQPHCGLPRKRAEARALDAEPLHAHRTQAEHRASHIACSLLHLYELCTKTDARLPFDREHNRRVLL